MEKMNSMDRIFDLDDVFTSTVLCASSEHKPFKFREALKLIEKLGRPLNDEEMKQFEY
ncbi:MAG: hypothetical protein IJE60_10505 [Tyzzerella sp.]|nr:hypothetical protein [Tyzzerella sp.]